MPVIMKRKYTFVTDDMTNEQKELYQKLIDMFRVRVLDNIPDKNILDKLQYHHSDTDIINYINTALNDINGEPPRTEFRIVYFAQKYGTNILVEGAIIFALIADGLLQLRNQVDYSDGGLSIAMFNKTTIYQSWVGFLLQTYMTSKQNIKKSCIASSINSGFVGISSDFAYWGSNW